MRRRSICSDCNMVGGRIRSIRESKGPGQGELIAKVQLQGSEMSQSKLSRIEGQQISVTDKDLYLIANALDVNVGDLFPSKPYLLETEFFSSS